MTKLQGEQIDLMAVAEATEAPEVIPEKTLGFDYTSLLNESKPSWEELTEETALPGILKDILLQTVLLPRGDLQVPIALSALSTPSALATSLPIIYSMGHSGSGKSALGKLACAIHDDSPISGGSTFASLRNRISASRFHDPKAGESAGNEKNCCTVWEDLNSRLLDTGEPIYAMLKNGIDRGASIEIASSISGENIQFPIFGLKYLSSIENLLSYPEYCELVRRCVVIEHKKYCDWLPNEQSVVFEGRTPDDLIKLEEYSFEGLNYYFEKFWRDNFTIITWKDLRVKIRRKKPKDLDSSLWQISKDLIVFGTVCEYFKDLNHGIDTFLQYWEWHKDNINNGLSPDALLLQEFISTLTQTQESNNQKMIDNGYPELVSPVEIQPDTIQKFLGAKAASGELTKVMSPQTRTEIMMQLGWKLRSDGKGSNRYVKI